MQAKSSVSDYNERGKLSWAASQAAAGTKQPDLEMVGSKSRQTQLKPGLY